MIKITNTETMGWRGALRGMRNPKNSWDKADSRFFNTDASDHSCWDICVDMGPNDLKLATTLANAGTDHGKLLRMIHVQCDILAPLYWWKEMDQYKVGTTTDSCSTMHKIHSKEFTLEDFSTDHLIDVVALSHVINDLNYYRDLFNHNEASEIERNRNLSKNDWWQMIQLLPSSYNQLRTWDANYAVLRDIYHARKNHKLDEWHEFCHWIESLPYAKELIIGE